MLKFFLKNKNVKTKPQYETASQLNSTKTLEKS